MVELAELETVVGYTRTSTGDQDQDPERQRRQLEAWADRNGLALAEVFHDVGTSAWETAPLDRDVAVKATVKAPELGARGVVCSEVSRWSRGGPRELWASVEELESAGLYWLEGRRPLEDQRGARWELLVSVEAALAYQEAAILSERVRSAMEEIDTAGRPRRELTEEEVALGERLQLEEGMGKRQIAREINKRRGYFELSRESRDLLSPATVMRRLKEAGAWHPEERMPDELEEGEDP